MRRFDYNTVLSDNLLGGSRRGARLYRIARVFGDMLHDGALPDVQIAEAAKQTAELALAS